MKLCTYQCIPHHPPLGPKWGFTGGIDTKPLPHYGAFDTGINRLTSYRELLPPSNPHVATGAYMGAYWGFDSLCLPHCGEFDIRVCQIPTIAPYNPEGGMVGEYIDRCIISLLGYSEA